jgi:hypothetical protein
VWWEKRPSATSGRTDSRCGVVCSRWVISYQMSLARSWLLID